MCFAEKARQVRSAASCRAEFKLGRGCEKTSGNRKAGGQRVQRQQLCEAPTVQSCLPAAVVRRQADRAYTDLLRAAWKSSWPVSTSCAGAPTYSARTFVILWPYLRTAPPAASGSPDSLSAAVARPLLSCIRSLRFGEPTPSVRDERPRLADEGRSAPRPLRPMIQ